ncbi:hypothetical protein JCM18916_866 [Cutibacterium acnes JCM 18916]|nr:hypothetical protein JCM18916_866 [Cutibacterium acnes JCM 18916]
MTIPELAPYGAWDHGRSLIIGIIIAALVGRSRSKTLRDEVWNKEHTGASEAHKDVGNESR